MRIGDAARALGVSRDTIRRFEARGIIVPRRDWVGNRRYSEVDLAALRARLYPASPQARRPRSPERAP